MHAARIFRLFAAFTLHSCRYFVNIMEGEVGVSIIFSRELSLYASETWTLLKADIVKLEAFHMTNTWHPLVRICYERGSRHPLTAAVHE